MSQATKLNDPMFLMCCANYHPPNGWTYRITAPSCCHCKGSWTILREATTLTCFPTVLHAFMKCIPQCSNPLEYHAVFPHLSALSKLITDIIDMHNRRGKCSVSAGHRLFWDQFGKERNLKKTNKTVKSTFRHVRLESWTDSQFLSAR